MSRSSEALSPSAKPRAMIPPVDVPAIRSKYLATEVPPRYRFSRPARKAAGKIPRIPPPSMERMRNCLFPGQGIRTRRRRSVPVDRFGTSLASSDTTPLLGDGVSPATHPFAGCKPAFITGQPLNSPRDDSPRNRTSRTPLARIRVIQAEKREFGVSAIWIMMRNWFTRSFLPPVQQWIDHRHLWQRPVDNPAIRFKVIRHLNCVGLAKWPKLSPPAYVATCPVEDPESRARLAHALDLLPRRHPSHSSRLLP